MTHPILAPALALILLTFVVWLVMYVQRLRYMVANKVSPRSIATPEQVNTVLPEHINRPSNNLKNLFEMPVIFYFVCAASLALPQDDILLTFFAWMYVALRALHSFIQCTSNHVPRRFAAYIGSCFILWIMVVRFAVGVFTA